MVRMPKRNKSKDNPYKLIYNEETEEYIVEFADNKKVVHKVEISKQLYLAFDLFELEDISQIHKYRKHIEHSELTEETLYNRLFEPSIGVEEIVEKIIGSVKKEDELILYENVDNVTVLKYVYKLNNFSIKCFYYCFKKDAEIKYNVVFSAVPKIVELDSHQPFDKSLLLMELK